MANHFHILLFILMSFSPICQSWGWFFSSSSSSDSAERAGPFTGNSVAEFSMNGIGDEKGAKLLEIAKSKLAGSNPCWQNAYQQLVAACSEILAVEEKRSRLAWHLSDCFEKDTGREPFPICDAKSPMVYCLKKLNGEEHKVYLEYFLETNSICYQLQAHSFKHKMERLVNDLKGSAEYTVDQLEIIQERTRLLSNTSDQIHEALSSIDSRVQNVAESSKDVKDHMIVLSQYSEAVYKKSREIADSQTGLREEQERMNEKLKEGMETIHDSYANLGQQVDNLKNEAAEIEKQIGAVGETMYIKMEKLQISADEIEGKAEKSLDNQEQLIHGQSTALKGLQLLTEFQSEALEESRSHLQRLAEYNRKQQEEMLQRQEQIKQIHDHLIENSKSILAAQEVFESKQEGMFLALDKLFALHNALLLESRIIKAFFIYSISIFIIYMFTSTKQTYTVRAKMYIGLVAAFLTEVAILRLATNKIEEQAWLINMVRSAYVVAGCVQFVHAIYTYRDYEVLNYKMIETLVDKVNEMERREIGWETERDVNWRSWIENELPNEVDKLEDPDYIIPEEIGENSITTSIRKYHLRPRR
ncbi:protein GAMETE EXPRESSED 1-like [Euphorbia lathyris]|uniref:protein GAMETE EXPRESSED 1-like n=1 Tax=Euphorbia lathyris TaxID=212925 RepID=UPI00331377F0